MNKILYYADKNGKMQNTPQRKVLIVADMIVSGEKEGPVMPSPKNVGVIAAGVNPVCFDEAISVLMGFDPDKIPTLQTIRKVKRYTIVDAETQANIYSNKMEYNSHTPLELSADIRWEFVPTEGWRGHIERN